ncbi:pyridoxal phosphate-dependent transferase [Coniochaeta sp. 2T2.1]|nr:pyridoxal phosphate-dependent transferase [Coniochaeta sp. 2T2.1]
MSSSSPPSTSHTDTDQHRLPFKKQINLLRGWPSPSLLPNLSLLSSAQSTLTDPSTYIPGLQYGPDPGYLPLREAISQWLSPIYQVGEGDVERICITGGASQNMACVLQSFSDPGYTRAVWMVAPCYFLAGPIFEDAGFVGGRGRLRGFGEDGEGADVRELEREIIKVEEAQQWPDEPVYKSLSPQRKAYKHIIYVVPTCANPSGTTMSLQRRRDLVNLARKYDCLVICDDVYDFLQWPVTKSASSSNSPSPLPLPTGTPLPRLVDIDLSLGRSEHDPEGKWFGHAISNGTFSKLIGPGVRTGWTETTPDFAYGLSQTGSTRSGGAPSQFAAMVVAEMVKSGEVDRHVEGKVRPALQKRHGLVLQAVRYHLGPYGVTVRSESQTGQGVYGGYFVWLTLPEDGPGARNVAGRAKREENLIVAEGEMFEVPGDERSPRFGRNLRLTFSWEEEGDVVEGVKRLGLVLGRMRAGERERVMEGLDVGRTYK